MQLCTLYSIVTRVWNKLELPEDNDSVCKICLDMVKQARDQLESNETQHSDMMQLCTLYSIVTRVWNKLELPEDNDSVCKICLDMVKQARDQLESNETQHSDARVEQAGTSEDNDSVCKICLDMVKQARDQLESNETQHSDARVEQAGTSEDNDSVCKICLDMVKQARTSSRATRRSIVTRVWNKLELPEDNDSVCKICLDMVKQARDQLESNETQSELKQVFEGSCKLIPIKVVAKECMRLADDFVPELVETLASEMNPQQVCSVAGLCNNDKIDQLLVKYNALAKQYEGCNNCQTTVGVLRKKFDATSYEDFLKSMLMTCGRFGSFSDSCSMLVFSYYENILGALKHDLTPRGMCHLSGQCAAQFHDHDEFTFPKPQLEGLKATDDVPCEFCEQLVTHMRDTLVANTTEMEFQRVLKGLCKQTGKFKDECLHLVDQYYAEIYDYLVNDIKPAEVCSMMGLCKDKVQIDTDVPIAPLLPKELAVKAVRIEPSSRLIGAEEAKIARIPVTKQANVRIMGSDPAPPPLPIERMFLQVPTAGANKFTCTFCQSFLHYLQVELSDTDNEEKVKEEVEKACDRLPQSMDSECRQFVTEYGPAVIALLVQQIDPSSVCPALRLCPQTQEVRRVDINAEKSNCPLCLFAVEQLESMLKNNHTEESIRDALDSLCGHLAPKLRTQCVDFVDQYSTQLVEMLVANMNAQEICVYLKLCTDDSTHTDPLRLSHSSIDKYHDKPQLMADRNNRRRPMLPDSMLVKQARGGDIEIVCLFLTHTDPLRLSHSSIDKYHDKPQLMADRNNRRRPMLPDSMLVKQARGGDIEIVCLFLTHTDPLRLSHSSIDKYHDKPQLMADRNNRRRPMLPDSMLVKQARGGDIGKRLSVSFLPTRPAKTVPLFDRQVLVRETADLLHSLLYLPSLSYPHGPAKTVPLFDRQVPRQAAAHGRPQQQTETHAT
ncbi:saposin-like type b, region 1 domain-containing protein [Phthorimaea operculella]|nr:saposin-like type b, region 1 domain-containing protein [Phthorimaea operculella]